MSIVLYQTMFPKWIVFFFVPQSCQMLKAMTSFSMIFSSYFVSLIFLTFQSIGSTAPTAITTPSSEAGGQEQGQRSVHLMSSQYLLYFILWFILLLVQLKRNNLFLSSELQLHLTTNWLRFETSYAPKIKLIIINNC